MTHGDVRLGHLDGLRAIAVLGVLLFHFKLPHFDGGYAGVDIFLSLSGFLITRNIAHAISAGTFSLRQFYIRRLYRLLPSSTVTILLTCLASYGIMAPGLLQAALDSARAALLFHANIYFHTKSGYFEDAPDLKPLLHMWSLSLEEQFYFLWAPLLVVLGCLPLRQWVMPAAALVLAGASLTFAVLMNGMYPSFVFFELPPRIFQFAAGAFLAFTPALRRSSNADAHLPLAPGETDEPAEPKVVNSLVAATVVCNTTSLLSVATIFISFAKLPPAASALQMLPTTLATCALIATPTSFLSHYVLSARLPSHIGDLSYAMYLVHWPLYVLGKYLTRALMMPDPHVLLLLAATYLLGLVLHHGVENPLRDSRNVLGRRVFAFGAGAALLVACAGSELLMASGVASGVERSVSESSELTDGIAPGRGTAFQLAVMSIRGVERQPHQIQYVEIGAEDAPHSGLVLIGNSYAKHLMYGLADVMLSRNLRMTAFSRGGCTFAGRKVAVRNSETCGPVRDRIWELLGGLNRTGLVVMVANNWVEKDGLTLEIQTPALYKDIRAAGHKLVILGRPPMSTMTPGGELRGYFQCVDFNRAKLQAGEKNPCVDISAGYCASPISYTDNVLRDVIAKYKMQIPRLDFKDYMCHDDESCRITGSRCRYPVHNETAVEEIGFVRNLNHLSSKASFNVAYVFDDFLFGKETGLLPDLRIRS